MKKVLLVFLALLLMTPQTINADDSIDPESLFLYSAHYVLIDQDTSEILLSHNSKDQIRPASITKALTVITALEMLDKTPLTTLYTAPQEAFDDLTPIASIADFQPGDTMSLDDYLYGIMLPSGADATRIMSMYLTQKPEGLIESMNALAQKIGMENSNFVNTSGLDEDDHYATVEDLALLIQYALKNDDFRRYYTTVEHTTTPTTKYPEGIEFQNYYLDGALERGFKQLYGAKSGYTELAERSLSSVASNGEMNLIFVSTNAPREEQLDTNLLDAISVYRHVFSDYQKKTLQKVGDSVATIDIGKRAKPYPIMASQEIIKYLDKTLTLPEDIAPTFVPVEGLVAPIAKDTVLGTLSYTVGDDLLYSETIVATQDISVSFRYHVFHWFKIILTGLLILIIIAILAILAIRNYRLYKIRQRRREQGWVRRK